MKKRLSLVAFVAVLMVGLLPVLTFSQKNENVVLRTITEELNRSFDLLKTEKEAPPYFMSFRVTDSKSTIIAANNGALAANITDRRRTLDSDIRVGDYNFDNTRITRSFGGGSFALPIEDDAEAIKRTIWLSMDDIYNSAVDQLRQAKQVKATTVEEEFKASDFSREKPQVERGQLARLDVESDVWVKRIRAYSGLIKGYREILMSSVTLSATETNKFFVNTEGASLTHGTSQVRLSVFATAKADDGMNLFKFESFDATTIEGLPDEKVIVAAIEKMAKDLIALRRAPRLEPYAGPAILSGRASGVFFHEIFGHRVEGHRQKSEHEGNTFTAKVEQLVLPKFFSVSDDPTIARFGATDLSGHYKYDDEGIKSRRVPLVQDGTLKTFLMSRSPIEGVGQSNGHGRAQPGLGVVSRQGNLIIESRKVVSKVELRRKLLAEVKRQGKEFGLFFDDISGGFTNTSRYSTQAFQVTPVMVYKVFPDGRPDELVRGLDMIGTPLTVFSKIIAADDTPEVFNGVCGAESGWVPVSAISPGILVEQIEVQKRVKARDLPPILPPPGVTPVSANKEDK